MNYKKISIVIPIYNESNNIPILAQEIELSLRQLQLPFEVIWVDDYSTDSSVQQIQSLDETIHRLHRHSQNSGQSSSIMTGVSASTGDLIVTLDGDLQNDPRDIPKLIEKLDQGDFDVVCGNRVMREDNKLRTLLSRIANRIVRKLFKLKVSDLGCTLRVFKKASLQNLEIMGEMHRVLVVYLQLSGARIEEIPVNHRPRIYGVSKYGYSRIGKLIFDVLLAIFYSKFRFRPLYYFGGISIVAFTIGTLLQTFAITFRVFGFKDYIDTTLVTGGLILQVSSLNFLSIGLIAEMLIRFRTNR